MRSVGILLFDDVEVLDFTGPFEVFSVAGRRAGSHPFNVFTVAQHEQPISARNRLVVTPGFSFANAPAIDILVVPGGLGTRREMENPAILSWVSDRARAAELVLSVCTGALLLGRAGLLDGLPVTTHHGALEELKAAAPAALVQGDRRMIDNGKLVIAAGVSSGIDASFHVIARLLGHDAARETAHYIEYPLDLNNLAAPARVSAPVV
jgi:transcriptional regulator GlxA family with amidase domain